MTTPSHHATDLWRAAAETQPARKWHTRWETATREATQLVVDAVAARAGMHILDLASGWGEPALALAAAVGPSGGVTATDIGRGALAVAEETAGERGIGNITFREADAMSLPFPDASFDAVTCRFGAMFFPDLAAVFRECRRVLRPGGRIALLAWGPHTQPYFDGFIGVLARHAQIPSRLLTDDAPHAFRFAQTERLRQPLAAAGFDAVEASQRSITVHWPGPPQELWEYYLDTSVTFRPYLDSLTPDAAARAAAESRAAFEPYFDGTATRVPAVTVLGTGNQRP